MRRLALLGTLGAFCLAMTGQTSGGSGCTAAATADIARKGYACGRAKGMAEGFADGGIRQILALRIWEEAGCRDFEALFKPGEPTGKVTAPQGDTEGVGRAPAQYSLAYRLEPAVAKPLNNQCPICGEMAEPYKPDTRFCGDYSSGQPRSAMGLSGCEPTMTITRCKRCNAAFWQDAEAGK
jgi:hypothetical protein